MKKVLLIIFGALLISSTQAQVLFEENFDAGVVPVPGWMIMGNSQNLASPNSSFAGGLAPELQFDNDPPFPNTTMRIISPQINTTTADQVIIRFKHMFEHVSGNSTAFNISVATRSSNGTWNVVWQQAPTTSIPAEGVNVLVDNANVGSASFQLCFVITGTSQVMKNWYIDNVQVLNPLNLDGAISSVDLPPMFVGKQPIKGKIANLGQTAITSYDLSWQVDGGDIHTTPFTGVNVPMGGSLSYLSADSLDLSAGNYDLLVWVANINGVPADDDPSNDTLLRELSIPAQIIYRIPMFEEFTSSTCAPCASFNNGTFNPFLASHTDDELTLVKYQMNWPGAGDPYYTAEGGVRRTYYGVNAVPDLYVDGKVCATNSGAINAAYNATAGTTCYVAIESTHEIQGNNVIIDANIVPYAAYNGVTVQMAIVEKITTQNVATNGETEFHHVMMKMVPNASGVNVNLVANQPVNYKYTIDMSQTNVEEMDDLMLAIFLQESNKTIIQSGYSVEVGAAVTSSIQDSAVNVPVADPINIYFSQPVRMIGGAPITNANVADLIAFKLGNSSGTPVGFTATINAAKTQITITPNPNLLFNTRYYLNVKSVENNLSVPTLPYTINFTTLLNISVPDISLNEFKLYPNPANSTLFISDVNNMKSIEIYSIVGNLVSKTDVSQNNGQYALNVSNLPAGLYIMKAIGAKEDKAVRFVITR